MSGTWKLKVENQQKPTVILLGVFHMANPKLDAVNIEFDDMLAPKRQEEIRECYSFSQFPRRPHLGDIWKWA